MGIDIKKIIGKFNEAVMLKKSNKTMTDSNAQQRINTILSDKSNFATKEAYKAIRTNVTFTLGTVGSGCKKIIITSSVTGEGKTTTCINLAIAFAQTGAKVIVIDADMRKPRVYRHLGLQKENGLSDVLCSMIDLKTAVKRCGDQAIDCITSGQIPPNPAELMASDNMKKVIDELSKTYDYIFIDTPPVTLVTDVVAIANCVDGVIIVARQNYTIHELLKRAIANLRFADAKILGYILNDVSMENKHYGGKLAYGHEYGYGYGYVEYGDDEKSENQTQKERPSFKRRRKDK